MKNILTKVVAFLLASVTLFSLTACKPSHDDAPTSKVILFIGDGMGPNHVYNTELYYGEQMYFSTFEYKTLVDTNSLSGVTDSAAAATAMATGTRVINSLVAKDLSGDLTSITEIAKENKYGTGVVTSDLITGATPAGFSSHADSRDNASAILLSQRYAKLDLLLGSGDYDRYESHFEGEGWTWVEEFDELSMKKKRFVATFDDVVYENGTNEEPTLTQLTTYAIEYMEKHYPTGYFLMIEGAKIDKASHSNDIETMMKNLMDFNNAVKVAEEKLIASGDAYSIIVTADHETGKLAKANSKPYLTDGLYHSAKHTDTPVNLYFSSTLDTVPEIISKNAILNTDIFLLCRYLLAV